MFDQIQLSTRLLHDVPAELCGNIKALIVINWYQLSNIFQSCWFFVLNLSKAMNFFAIFVVCTSQILIASGKYKIVLVELHKVLNDVYCTQLVPH